MSLFQEMECTNYNIFEDFSNLNEGYNNISNECDYINIDLNEDLEHNNNNSPLLSKYETHKEIDNDKFLKYFMNIDYTTDFLNDISSKEAINNINKNEKKIKNEKKEIENVSTESQLTKKTQREKENGIIYDELTKITYVEKDDPIAFRKAKKRIQNRESALRMKKLKQINLMKNEDEINHLKKENEFLKYENSNLKKEKKFLIEQIKVMQNIINDSKIEFNNKIGKIKEYENQEIFYDGSKQKIKGKLFNIFIICLLSIIYIIGETDSNESSIHNSKKNISMNSVKEKNKSRILWNLFSKIILFIIFLLIIPLIKSLTKLPFIISSYNNKKKYI